MMLVKSAIPHEYFNLLKCQKRIKLFVSFVKSYENRYIKNTYTHTHQLIKLQKQFPAVLIAE